MLTLNLKKQNTIDNIYYFFVGIKHRFKNVYWWVRHRTTDKYHIVKMPSLKPGYAEVSFRILHSSFDLLCEFVEKEANLVDWDWNEEVRYVFKEMNELYIWWKQIRPNREEGHSAFNVPVSKKKTIIVNPEEKDKSKRCYRWEDDDTAENIAAWNKACETMNKLEAYWEQEDQENLIRLAKIRKYLWT